MAAAAGSSHPSNQGRPKSGRTPYNEGPERRSRGQEAKVQGEGANNSLPLSYNDKETDTGSQAMHPGNQGRPKSGRTPYSEGPEEKSKSQEGRVHGDRDNDNSPVSYNDGAMDTGNQKIQPGHKGRPTSGRSEASQNQYTGTKDNYNQDRVPISFNEDAEMAAAAAGSQGKHHAYQDSRDPEIGQVRQDPLKKNDESEPENARSDQDNYNKRSKDPMSGADAPDTDAEGPNQGLNDEQPFHDGGRSAGEQSDDGLYQDGNQGNYGDDDGKAHFSDGDHYDDSDDEYPFSGENYGGGMPGVVVGAMAQSRDQGQGKRGKNKNDHGRGRYGYKPRKGQANMENHGKFKYNRDPKKWFYNRRTGNWERLKDHEFEWSEEFKKRQKMSVYDRLLGGVGKGGAEARKPLNQGKDATKAAAVIRAWGGNDGKENRYFRARDISPAKAWGGNDGKQNRQYRQRDESPNKASNRDASPNKGTNKQGAKVDDETQRDHSRGRYNYKPRPGQASMENHGPFQYDRDPKKWDYKKAEGNWEKVKDHEFEWSKEYKNRQKLSVYDRLLGGAKTLKEVKKSQKEA